MNIVFLGADVPSNKTILGSMNASHVGVSYWGLVRRGLPKTKKYLLENYFHDEVKIHVYPGLPLESNLSQAELEDFCADYEEFIADNLNRIALFTEVQHKNLTPEFINTQRASAWAEVPEEKFAAVFTGNDLESLATRYLNVCIPGSLLEEKPELEGVARRYAAQHGTVFHALGVAKPDSMRNSPFETVSTLAWLSPMMRGETIVWFGGKLVRYPKRMKEQARSRYKVVYELARLDFDKILADDAVEVSKLAVWSYQQLEQWLNKVDIVTMSDDIVTSGNAETPSSDVTMRGGNTRKLSPRNPAEMRTIPVVGVEIKRVIEPDDEGRDVLKEVPTLRSSSNSLRACDSCFVSANCPAYQPQSTCAFNLPLEVKTKEQLKSLINTMLEIQGQRVVFSKFTEDLNGGYPDPNVGVEMDRLFKMMKTVKELDDSKEVFRMTVERQGSAGVLSSLFGDKAQTLNELPNNGLNPEQTNNLIQRLNEDNS
jgi:hypothetical protein